MTEATDVRDELDKMREQNFDRHIDEFSDSIEGFMQKVVEDGTFTPDGRVTGELDLTPSERMSGTREQDMTGIFVTGLILGSALERDIPSGSDDEEQWRNGEYELPSEDE